jgi:trimethyllysine dioxygenase
VPPTEKDTEALVKRVSFIKHTYYGGFCVMHADMKHNDVAYSTSKLNLHTDNNYFTEPAGVEFLHIIHHDGQGGHSLFADGFYLASQLSKEDYDTLSTLRVPPRLAGDVDGHYLPTPSTMPILNLHPVTNELYAVRFNNEDRGVMCNMPLDDQERFYRAFMNWLALTKSPENVVEMKLHPGTVVGFNNWRALHGRTQFTGNRSLCSSYCGHDDWRSRLHVLRRRLQ